MCMVCIFFGEEFSSQESCDKHVLIGQRGVFLKKTVPWTVEGMAWDSCYS